MACLVQAAIHAQNIRISKPRSTATEWNPFRILPFAILHARPGGRVARRSPCCAFRMRGEGISVPWSLPKNWPERRGFILRRTAAAGCTAGETPFVPGGPHFNLSHSGRFAVLIIGDARPVGVDVEAAGRQADVLRIAERFFVRHECEALHAATDAERDPLLKATGLGMRLPPDRISVQLEDGVPVSVIRTDSGEAWPLHCRELADCVVCAVEL